MVHWRFPLPEVARVGHPPHYIGTPHYIGNRGALLFLSLGMVLWPTHPIGPYYICGAPRIFLSFLPVIPTDPIIFSQPILVLKVSSRTFLAFAHYFYRRFECVPMLVSVFFRKLSIIPVNYNYNYNSPCACITTAHWGITD